MTPHRKLGTFDWALKCLLRSKANFRVLEGFMSELLHDDIEIVELLESEGNKEIREDTANSRSRRERGMSGEEVAEGGFFLKLAKERIGCGF